MGLNRPVVVLTRTESGPQDLHLKYPSVNWLNFPLINFDYQALNSGLIEKIQLDYDWLLFTSQNGVKSFFQQEVDLKGKKIACVGPKTASLVESMGHQVAFMPSHFTSIYLAKELPSKNHESICYVGGNLSSEATINVLKDRTRKFLQIETYRTVHKRHSEETWKTLLTSELDVISFCSPSAVQSYIDQTREYNLCANKKVQFAAIGTTTASAIEDLLKQRAIIPSKHTFATMIDEIVRVL
jgi:uroporphyrinogen-III synthase